MDKSYNRFNADVPHKKGFALLITLSVFGILIALTGTLLGYFDTVRKEAGETKALIQGNLYYTDIKKMMGKFKEKKTLFNTLYMMPIPLVSPDGRFHILLRCYPRANGININWLGSGENPKRTEQFQMAQMVFDYLVQYYTLEDPEKLEALFLEEIGESEHFFHGKDKRLFQKKGIVSSKQFNMILQRYQFATDDDKVFKVPWEKYFVFGEDTMLIDGDYLSAELISLLFDIDIETVREEWIRGTTKLKVFVKSMGGTYNDTLYAKKFVEEAKCSIDYRYQEVQYAFTFVESGGEVKDFEFLGKQ